MLTGRKKTSIGFIQLYWKEQSFMKKLILALIALGFAFAISSCCDQSYCPQNMRCDERGYQQSEETPYRFDTKEQVQPNQERQHRRW